MNIDSSNIYVYPASNRDAEYLGNLLIEQNISSQVDNLLDYNNTVLNLDSNAYFNINWISPTKLNITLPNISCIIDGYIIKIKSQIVQFENEYLDRSKLYSLLLHLNIGDKSIVQGAGHTKSITVKQIKSVDGINDNMLDRNGEFKGLEVIISDQEELQRPNSLYLGTILNNVFTLNNYIQSKFSINKCKITTTREYDSNTNTYIYNNGIINSDSDSIAIIKDDTNDKSRVCFLDNIINSGKINNKYNDYLILDDGEF